MVKRPFCYLCGAETGELYDGLCRECVLKEKSLAQLPETLESRLCRNCLSIYSEVWEASGQDVENTIKGLGERLVRDNLGHELEYPEVEVTQGGLERRGRTIIAPLDVTVRGLYKKLPYGTRLKTTLKVSMVLCPVCSKQAGGYYEAVLQFRGAYKEVLDEAYTLIRDHYKKDKSAFISEETLVKSGGLDIKLGSKRAAKAVATHFKTRHKAQVKESATLTGRKNGKDLYRVTYLIRL